MNQQECPEKQEQTLVDGSGGRVELQDVDAVAFAAEERERLARLRRRVQRGEVSDHYPVDKHQDFIRWLVDHGKLSDN